MSGTSLTDTSSSSSTSLSPTSWSPVYFAESKNPRPYSSMSDIIPADVVLQINSFLPQPYGFFLLLAMTDRGKEFQKSLYERYNFTDTTFKLSPTYFRYTDLSNPSSFFRYIVNVSISNHCEDLRTRLRLLPSLKRIQIFGHFLEGIELENYLSLEQGNVLQRFNSNLIDGVGTKKIVVLGTGESGKSTFMSQLDMMTNTRESLDDANLAIKNIAHTTKIVCNMFLDRGKKLDDAKAELARLYFNEATFEDDSFETRIDSTLEVKKLYKQIVSLWSERDFVEMFENNRITTSKIHDGAKHQMEFQNLLRYDPVCKNNKPSFYHRDLFYCYKRTSWMMRLHFSYQMSNYYVCTFGGQKSERRKWKHGLEDSNCIIYLVSLVDYCRQCFEDATINRYLDSVQQFQSLVRLEQSKNKPIHLVFTKTDLFDESLISYPLSTYFPEYVGKTRDEAFNFLLSPYLANDQETNKRIQIHSFCTLDSQRLSTFCDLIL